LLERSLRHPLDDDVDGQTDPLRSRVLTGVTSFSGTAVMTLKVLLLPLLRLLDEVDVAAVEDELKSTVLKRLFSVVVTDGEAK